MQVHVHVVPEGTRFLPSQVAAFNALLREVSPHAPRVDERDLERVTRLGTLLALKMLPASPEHPTGIIGMATLVHAPTLRGLHGIVEDVAVHRDFRGHGYGNVLLQALIGHAEELHMAQLRLTSADHRKKAIALYERLGFTRVETNVFRLTL